MTRKRRVLAVGGLVLLVFLSGCTLIGSGGEVSEEDLTQEATYDWERNATASFNVTTAPLLSFSSNEYQAVVETDNTSTLEIYRQSVFRGDRPVSIEALQFQYPNGTIITADEHDNLTAFEESDETVIEVPAEAGKVAYTSDWGGATAWGGSPRTFRVPNFVDGSYEVTMPDGSRADIPLMSATRPSGSESSIENNRLTLYWDDPGSTISVRYYHERDLYIFGSLFVVGVVLAIGGGAYYYRSIQQAREKRKEVGLDVEEEQDDFDKKRPPPGMR